MAIDHDMTSVWDAVERSTNWLDAHHEPDDTEITMRLLKLTEEAGEAAQAWIGATGRNPRKGVTHSRRDVAAELADVVFSALVAISSLGLDPAAVLTDKARTLIARTGAGPDGDARAEALSEPSSRQRTAAALQAAARPGPGARSSRVASPPPTAPDEH